MQQNKYRNIQLLTPVSSLCSSKKQRTIEYMKKFVFETLAHKTNFSYEQIIQVFSDICNDTISKSSKDIIDTFQQNIEYRHILDTTLEKV